MGKMQRTKGASFERDIVKDLVAKGYDDAKRNLEQVREGGGDINLPGYLIECKRYANIAVYKWLEQAEKAKKDGGAGEDDITRAEKHLDELTKKHEQHIDEILKHKEAELLEV